MTVSKALRNCNDISTETRQRVQARARELQYQPNLIARGLASSRTYLIGLIIPDMMHSFFAEVAKGIGQKLEPLGYQIVICNSEESAETELRQIKLLLARSVDGLILASSAAASGSRELLALLQSHGTPYVFIDRAVRGCKGNYVGMKDTELGTTATAHLIECGCRRIAHISGPMATNGKGRLQGYQHALAKHKMRFRPEYVVSGVHEDAGGYGAMQKLLQVKPRPDGVFCYNDPVAIGAMKAIREAGLRVPEDIAVIGAGNVHYSDLLAVPLSTIDQSNHAIGETAAAVLLECIESKKPGMPKRVFFSPRVIVRKSTAQASVVLTK